MDYFGEQNQGNERSNSSSSSSRKGKNSSKSNKPKQPQRGLGVAQLEKIRLQGQFGCSYLASPCGPFHPNLTQEHMGIQEAYSSPPTSSPFTYNFHGHQSIMLATQSASKMMILEFYSKCLQSVSPNVSSTSLEVIQS